MNLKREIPDITQPWYADDAGSIGMFVRLETYADFLTYQGLGQGYHTKPTKSVLIVGLEILEAGNCLGHDTDLGFARVHVILGVKLGTTSPNVIG